MIADGQRLLVVGRAGRGPVDVHLAGGQVVVRGGVAGLFQVLVKQDPDVHPAPGGGGQVGLGPEVDQLVHGQVDRGAGLADEAVDRPDPVVRLDQHPDRGGLVALLVPVVPGVLVPGVMALGGVGMVRGGRLRARPRGQGAPAHGGGGQDGGGDHLQRLAIHAGALPARRRVGVSVGVGPHVSRIPGIMRAPAASRTSPGVSAGRPARGPAVERWLYGRCPGRRQE
jgi:hypothetical protein